MQRIAILGLTLALGTAAALAQGRVGDFPSQPLRLIIGFPPPGLSALDPESLLLPALTGIGLVSTSTSGICSSV